MATVLLERDVKIRRISSIGRRAARALSDPVRLQILEMLSHKAMTADEIGRILNSLGNGKATTTIRHHLDNLRSAGLVEASKMVEVRGAVMKYYFPTLRVFGFDAPSNIDENHSRLINETSSKLRKVLKGVLENKKLLAGFEGSEYGTVCPLCKADHFREFAALEIVNAALANAFAKIASEASGTVTKDPKRAENRNRTSRD